MVTQQHSEVVQFRMAWISVLGVLACELMAGIWWAAVTTSKLDYVISAVTRFEGAEDKRADLATKVEVLSNRVAAMEQRLK